MNFGHHSNAPTALSPILGGAGIGVAGGFGGHTREHNLPRNWIEPTIRRTDLAEGRQRHKALQQPIEPPRPAESEVKSDVHNLHDIQTDFGKALIMALLLGAIGALKTKKEASRRLEPVLADLKAVRQEELETEQPITPYAYATALVTLNAAYFVTDADIPHPAIAPDGEGGIRLEWVQPGRNVRVVVPPRRAERAYIYYRINDESGIDRLLGKNLAERLNQFVG